MVSGAPQFAFDKCFLPRTTCPFSRAVRAANPTQLLLPLLVYFAFVTITQLISHFSLANGYIISNIFPFLRNNIMFYKNIISFLVFFRKKN